MLFEHRAWMRANASSSAEVLRDGFEAAGIVKLNDEELPVVLECLRSKEGTHTPLPEGPEGLEVGGKELLGMFTLKLLCITRGGEGAFLMRPGEELVKVSPVPCVVADTIGAGDSFTAALVHHFLRGKLSLQEMGDAANKWAAWVASQTGATPAVDPAVKKAVTGAGSDTETPPASLSTRKAERPVSTSPM